MEWMEKQARMALLECPEARQCNKQTLFQSLSYIRGKIMKTMRNISRRGLFAILIILLIFPACRAGTENDPEISDGVNDVTVMGAAPLPIPLIFDGIDIVSGWCWGESSDFVYATLKLKDLKMEELERNIDVRYLFDTILEKVDGTKIEYQFVAYTWNSDINHMKYTLFCEPYGNEPCTYEIDGYSDISNSTVTYIISRKLMDFPLSGESLLVKYARADSIYGPAYLIDGALGNKTYAFKNSTSSAISIDCKENTIECDSERGNVSFEIFVRNNASNETIVDINACGVGGWSYNFNPNHFKINSSTVQKVILNVEIQQNLGKDNIPIKIIASSSAGRIATDVNIKIIEKKEISNAGEGIPGFEVFSVISTILFFVALCRKK
jgi:hypothetical protein